MISDYDILTTSQHGIKVLVRWRCICWR